MCQVCANPAQYLGGSNHLPSSSKGRITIVPTHTHTHTMSLVDSTYADEEVKNLCTLVPYSLKHGG